MKKSLSLLIAMFPLLVFSQDTIKIKQIDSIVRSINNSNLYMNYDSTVVDKPELGLYIKTYLTGYFSGKELIRYAQVANGTRKEEGKTSTMVASSVFYFNQQQLIKVVEVGANSENGKTANINVDWYFENDRLLFSTMKDQKAADRGQLLLKMAKSILMVVERKQGN